MAVWSEDTAPSCYHHNFAAHSNPYTHTHTHTHTYIYTVVCMYVCLVAWCNSNPMAASGAHPLRFPVWLGIPKPMIPYPLLWEGTVRTVGSHLGRIPNCSELPDTPPPPGNRPPRRP